MTIMDGTETGVKKPKPSLPAETTDTIQTDFQPSGTDDGGDEKEKKSQRDRAIAIGMMHILSHDDDGTGYASIATGQRCEHLQIRSRLYKNYITASYFDIYGTGLSKQAQAETLDTLEAVANRRGIRVIPALRCARLEGVIELDLCNELRQIVIVTRDGWRVGNNTEAKAFFPRKTGQLSHKLPVKVKGALKKFFALFGVTDTKSQILISSWLLSCLCPGTPSPILILNGGQGSGKTALAQALVRLIDPQSPELSTLPTDERDLCIAARAALLLGFDNVSRISPEMSDAFCRLATGGGIKNRKLFTDDEQVTFAGIRPVIFNGIPDLISADDLRERSIVITLETIEEKDRKPLEIIEQQFYLLAAGVLGDLLDAASAVLKAAGSKPPDRLTRMADFEVLARAGAEALGYTADEFSSAYRENLKCSLENVLDGNLVARLIRALPHGFEGTYAQLLKELREQADSWEVKDLPRSARQLSNAVRRLIPGLGSMNVFVTHRKTDGVKFVTIVQKHK